MSLYGWIILLSFAGPFALSFDKKVAFFKDWSFVVLAAICVAIPFLIWDEFFTQWGVWGFNPRYLFKVYLGHLPLEEVLFFFVIPYNFIFLLRVIQAYFPNRNVAKLPQLFAFLFIFSSVLWVLLYAKNYYTFLACALSGVLTLLLRKKKMVPRLHVGLPAMFAALFYRQWYSYRCSYRRANCLVQCVSHHWLAYD